ncbi:MAG: phytanoyl-CoA dioxygenase family protein [Lentisphaerae bacterium]|nr:phytanoyl-CoA dioxygenase family protein [Lentisphaerota bacterium]
MSLTDSERAQFQRDGYVVRAGVFNEAALQPIRRAITAVIDREAVRLQGEGKLTDLFRDEPFETRFARMLAASPDAGRAIYATLLGKGGGGFKGPEMFEMLTHAPLLGCIESLIGPEIIGSSVYRIRPKLPNWVHGEVPWHQDSGYLLSHCDQFLIVTCWIPLVDATLDNGCLYVIPGAHRTGVYRHYTGGHGGFLEIPADDLPAGAIPLEMKAGSILFMTNLTPHASFANRTQAVRWSVDLRYQSPDAPTNADEAPESYTPEREPVTMACFPPEADFVIRSPSNPAREIRTAEQFHAVRDRYERAQPYMPGRGWTSLKQRVTQT